MSDKQKEFVKKWLGMPVRWERKNMFKNFWNAQDDRIFPPKHFGVGWDINFLALLKGMGIVKKKRIRNNRLNIRA